MVILWACAEPPPEEPRFVRGGLVRGGRFEARAWQPGEVVEGVTAPRQPECVPLFSVELEDVRREAAMQAPLPGAALAFSPDGAWLAIGSERGSLRVVDAWTGAERASTTLAEAAVKALAWSADGQTLYVGEQSPDAFLYAMDADLGLRWRHRLADAVQSSRPPPKDDIYGLYSLPAAYFLAVTGDGSVLVSAAHGWTDEAGRHNRSQLLRIEADGRVRARWPEQPADAVMLKLAVAGESALVPISRSADGPPPELPIGGVVHLDLRTMSPTWTRVFPPLAPWFKNVFMWDAVGLDEAHAFVGLGDGRAFFLDARDGAERARFDHGVPVDASGVPIAAGVGFGLLDGDAFFATTETNIPFGSADPALRPPSAHPAEFRLHAVGPDLRPRWSTSPGVNIAGVVPSPDGRLLAVGGGPRLSDRRTDAFGLVLLERESGRVAGTCPTEGPVFFRPSWGGERIAVSEGPWLDGGDVRGSYRVTVFR